MYRGSERCQKCCSISTESCAFRNGRLVHREWTPLGHYVQGRLRSNDIWSDLDSDLSVGRREWARWAVHLQLDLEHFLSGADCVSAECYGMVPKTQAQGS